MTLFRAYRIARRAGLKLGFHGSNEIQCFGNITL